MITRKKKKRKRSLLLLIFLLPFLSLSLKGLGGLGCKIMSRWWEVHSERMYVHVFIPCFEDLYCCFSCHFSVTFSKPGVLALNTKVCSKMQRQECDSCMLSNLFFVWKKKITSVRRVFLGQKLSIYPFFAQVKDKEIPTFFLFLLWIALLVPTCFVIALEHVIFSQSTGWLQGLIQDFRCKEEERQPRI